MPSINRCTTESPHSAIQVFLVVSRIISLLRLFSTVGALGRASFKAVMLTSYVDFTITQKHNLDFKISSQTVRLVARSTNFSSQAVRTKRSGYKSTRTASAKLYAKYLNEIARPTLRSNRAILFARWISPYTNHLPMLKRIVNSYVRVSAICRCSMLSPYFRYNIR